MEHSAKEIMDMAYKTLGEEVMPEVEAVPEITEFKKPLADIVIEEDGTHVDPNTGEVIEESVTVVMTEEFPADSGMETLGESEPVVPPQSSAVTLYQRPQNNVAAYDPSFVRLPEDNRPSVQATTYNKFADFPQQLREDVSSGIDLHEVKRLNLATIIEALEQAAQSYSSFPSTDNALAVSTLSSQAQRLTVDLEKSNDPKKLAATLEADLLNRYSLDMLQAVTTEMKFFMEQVKTMIPIEHQPAFVKLMQSIVSERMGPAMQETLRNNIVRLHKVLGIKEKV